MIKKNHSNLAKNYNPDYPKQSMNQIPVMVLVR
jgi:hypothetical protein